MEGVEFLYVQPQEYSRLIELSDQAFGPGYLKPEHFFDTHETFIVAVEDFHIHGFAGCSVSRGYGNINSVVVDPAAKGRGIGTRLVHACLLHLWNLGVRWVESQAWERSDNGLVGLKVPLERNGFFKYGREEDFYVDVHSAGAECIVCGSHCKCAALMYKLEMEDIPPKEP